jgi:uncharacterized protein
LPTDLPFEAPGQNISSSDSPMVTGGVTIDTGAPLCSGPVSSTERIGSMDVLRGFALLGILLLNIQSFSMPSIAYVNPTAFGELQGLEYAVWWGCHVLGDQKFMSIFAMLFGAGIVLMTLGGESKTGRSAAIHYRRMLWLILLGLVHAYLLWYGDILFSYGICGLFLWPVRHWSAKILIPIGVFLIFVGALPNLLIGLTIPFWPEEAMTEIAKEWQPDQQAIQSELDAYRGSWLDQAPYRSLNALMFQTVGLALWVFWRATGLMLVGMGLFKLGYFQAKWSSLTYGLLALFGFAVGISISAYGVHWNEIRGWSVEQSFFLGGLWNYFGSLFTAIGLVSLILLVYKNRILFGQYSLAAIGQTALSNYLLQTLICTTIFYGHGLGYFGYLSRLEQLLVVLGIWAVQCTLSPLWLRYFRFGPAEWMWRSLTYWKRQPMRRAAANGG